MSKPIEPGQRYLRLTVVSKTSPIVTPKGKVHEAWLCVCDCGKETVAQSRRLRAGTKRSCGCLQNDTLVKNSIRHGIHHTGGYKAWSEMMKRCYRPNHISYPNYGGRGIKVAVRWHDVLKFVEDMGHPEEGQSLDRIESNKNYQPGNCRWAIRLVQNRNKRNTKRYELDGLNLTTGEWGEKTGVSGDLIAVRILRGWDVRAAIFTPTRKITRK